MSSNNTLPEGMINPFSEAFIDTWQLWKDFRWQAHKFKYKSPISEQLKLVQLAKLADGDEATAIAMVQQSIGNGWMDFYKLKTIKVSENGTKQRSSKMETRQSVNDLYNKRFGSR